MPDPLERKRLKKKMLDRWENEGGRIAADSAGGDETKPTREADRPGQPLASRENTTAGGSASRAKRRKARK